MTGEDIMSPAFLLCLIRLIKRASSVRSTWINVWSLMVAEAASGCPPPPNAPAISAASTVSTRLRATRKMRFSICASAKTTFRLSISMKRCTRTAKSGTNSSVMTLLMTISVPLIIRVVADCIRSLSSQRFSVVSSRVSMSEITLWSAPWAASQAAAS